MKNLCDEIQNYIVTFFILYPDMIEAWPYKINNNTTENMLDIITTLKLLDVGVCLFKKIFFVERKIRIKI